MRKKAKKENPERRSLKKKEKQRNPERLGTYVKNNYWFYIFLAPALIYFLIFNYGPMYGVLIAFQDFNPIKGISGSEWVGFQNFKILFTSEKFWSIFRNSLWINILKLTWGFPVPILLAILLSELTMKRFAKVSQTVLYLPHFISWVVLSGILINLLSTSNGAVNKLIEALGGQPVEFIQNPKMFRTTLVVSEIWKEAGWSAIVYIAAIAGVDRQLYEAAIMDGAGTLKRIRYVTIPSIMPTVVVMFILRLGSVLRDGFEQIFMLYSASVYEVADVFETFTYRMGIKSGQYSYATAVGLFQSVVGLILVVTANKLAKKYGEGGIW